MTARASPLAVPLNATIAPDVRMLTSPGHPSVGAPTAATDAAPSTARSLIKKERVVKGFVPVTPLMSEHLQRGEEVAGCEVKDSMSLASDTSDHRLISMQLTDQYRMSIGSGGGVKGKVNGSGITSTEGPLSISPRSLPATSLPTSPSWMKKSTSLSSTTGNGTHTQPAEATQAMEMFSNPLRGKKPTHSNMMAIGKLNRLRSENTIRSNEDD